LVNSALVSASPHSFRSGQKGRRHVEVATGAPNDFVGPATGAINDVLSLTCVP
jgi:hypothetical protein